MFRMQQISSATFAFVAVVLISALTSSLSAQTVEPPVVEWERTFGGTDDDWASSVQQTTDGGYILAGFTSSFGTGAGDVYLIKTDADGTVTRGWPKTFGRLKFVSFGYSVQQTTDGGYIVAGEVFSHDSGGTDVSLIKTNANGNLGWSKTFGGAAADDETAFSVRQTRDGGFIVAGLTGSFGAGFDDVYLLKTDANGIVSPGWPKTFGGLDNDGASSVQQTTDGGYIVAGWTSSFGAGGDVYLLKTDALGNLLWQETFGGVGYDVASEVQQTIDGGYIVAGETWSRDFSSEDIYLLKTDANGIVSPGWPKTFGGANNDAATSVQQTTDGGYIVAGLTGSFGAGFDDVYLLKTDALGNKVWQNTYGGAGNDLGYSVQQTADGGYIVAGWTSSFGAGTSDAYLIKLTPEGLPQPPQNLTATPGPGQSIQLTWVDASDNETKFIIERKLDLGTWQKLAEVPASTTTYQDVNVPFGEVCYRVSAVNDVGLSNPTPSACVTIELPQPPAPPTGLTVELDPASTGIIAVTLAWDSSPEADSYILERRIGLCEDWQQIGEEIPSKYTTVSDFGLPRSERVCYRVLAQTTNGISQPSEPACLVTRGYVWQLMIYVPADDPTQIGRWENLRPCDPRFQTQYGTAVIVHGWNPPNDLLCVPPFNVCHWDGNLNTNSLGQSFWVREIARQIHERDGTVNILAWDWLYLATNTLGDTIHYIGGQALQLANILKTVLPKDYTYPIHVMGHSLGTLVGSEACLELMEPRQSLPGIFRPRQLTLWDPPDGRPYFLSVWSNLTDLVQQLRARGVYVDLYAGLTNRGTHFANLVVDVPGDGHDVFNWYRTTIPDGVNPRLFVPVDDAVFPANGTVGFGASVLPPGDPIRPDDACPNGFGTLQFSHPENWLSRDFLLTGYWCATWDEPTRKLIESLNAGSFSGDCDPLRCVNQSPTRIALGTAATGAGAGGGATAGLVATYSLDLTTDPTWDYLSFQYQFDAAPVAATLSLTITRSDQTFNVWSISSDQVVFAEFLDSRRTSIASFQGQTVTIRFDLRCAEPGAAVLIQDLTFWQSPTHGNHPPEADAGPDQEVAANSNGPTTVTLDGTKTRDEDGDELSYRWLLGGNLLATGAQPTVVLLPGNFEITLVVGDPTGQEDRDTVTIIVGNSFRRGDSNADGEVDISDAINTLGYLFTGSGSVTCEDGADANDDGTLDISDPVFALGFLFLGSPPIIPEPFPNRGQDPTFDNLSCERY